ncbi:hypothetical protein [Nonomuraea candida]|uniref:hypothetical protein n=1 Tax=Nonomuraea candida TaxID=359159 RepID=UPI000A67EEA3|nr:hypothetical protein [Nonomuraea candida]
MTPARTIPQTATLTTTTGDTGDTGDDTSATPTDTGAEVPSGDGSGTGAHPGGHRPPEVT